MHSFDQVDDGDVQGFLEAYKGVEFTKSPEKYFKYSVQDVQAMLIDTFNNRQTSA